MVGLIESEAKTPIPTGVNDTEGSDNHWKVQETPNAAAAFAASLPDIPSESANCNAIWLAAWNNLQKCHPHCHTQSLLCTTSMSYWLQASVASTTVFSMSSAFIKRLLLFWSLVKGPASGSIQKMGQPT